MTAEPTEEYLNQFDTAVSDAARVYSILENINRISVGELKPRSTPTIKLSVRREVEHRVLREGENSWKIHEKKLVWKFR